jgi:hypothetical protein
VCETSDLGLNDSYRAFRGSHEASMIILDKLFEIVSTLLRVRKAESHHRGAPNVLGRTVPGLP